MIVLVVDGKRYLFNDEVCDLAQDSAAQRILKYHREDAVVEFDEVRPQDIKPISISLIK